MDNQELISKFLTGEITDAGLEQLKQWLAQDSENRKIFNQENELWHQAGAHTRLHDYSTDRAWQIVSQKLGFREQESGKVIILSKSRFSLMVVAASLLILITLGGLGYLLFQRTGLQQGMTDKTIITSNVGEKSHIFLADSTEVYLNSKSMLSFDGSYNKKDRDIYLSGEAFFNVRTNAGKPFVVNVDQLQVTATGTRFNVSAYVDDPRIAATLEEGRIYVSLPPGRKIFLKEGDQLVYDRETKGAVLHSVSTKTFTAWKENELRFADAPLEEVMRRIGRNFNVDIIIDDPAILNLKFTATFTDESIEEILQMMKMVSPIEYKIIRQATRDEGTYVKPKVVISAKRTSVQKQTNVKPN